MERPGGEELLAPVALRYQFNAGSVAMVYLNGDTVYGLDVLHGSLAPHVHVPDVLVRQAEEELGILIGPQDELPPAPTFPDQALEILDQAHGRGTPWGYKKTLPPGVRGPPNARGG